MRINAYILAADPAWIESSVLSYYPIVDQIVVSYDQDHLGYTGKPVAVDECLRRLRAIDRAGKLIFSPGHYARTNCPPMANETFQRQRALDEAGKTADWVLQLDTDEVLADSEIFVGCLRDADRDGFDAMDFPARWIYRQLGNDRYLESCRSLWSITAGFPGPVAVRAQSRLRYARQCDARVYRVDFRSRNTDTWRPKDALVHRAISSSQGIYHFSLVRSEESLRRKTQTFSHANDVNWEAEINHWLWCGRHPYLAAARGVFVRGGHVGLYRRPLRLVRIRLPQAVAGFNTDDGGEGRVFTSVAAVHLF